MRNDSEKFNFFLKNYLHFKYNYKLLYFPSNSMVFFLTGYASIANLLIRSGADVNYQQNGGNSPISRASVLGIYIKCI